jgi:nucleotide-binding universal stress UspA family protein
MSPPRIMIGVDGSACSDHALDALVQRTWPAGTRMCAVCCVSEVGALLHELPGAAAWFRTESATGSGDLGDPERRIIERAAARLRSCGHEVETELVYGSPRTMLVHEAARWHADCLVVGARGLSAVGRLLLGSVSTTVSARAPCTVEVIRHPD